MFSSPSPTFWRAQILPFEGFLHKKHVNNQVGKFHLKLNINSDEIKKLSRIDSNKKIYKVLNDELKEYIHSIQILIN